MGIDRFQKYSRILDPAGFTRRMLAWTAEWSRRFGRISMSMGRFSFVAVLGRFAGGCQGALLLRVQVALKPSRRSRLLRDFSLT